MRTVLTAFSATYGGREVAKMGRRDIERWLESRAHLSAGTRRNEVVIVRGFVRWLRQERKIKGDPMISVKSPKVPRSVPRALSDEEAARLWAGLPDARARAMVALMLGMGLRRGEVIALQTGDWDQSAGLMRVVGKGGHTRLVPVPVGVAEVLAVYLTGMRAGPLVRRHDGVTGISNSYIGRLTRTWMENADIKAGAFDGRACHSLRHTLASRVADKEPDLRVLQQILGHVSLTSTQIYLRHAEMPRLRAAMERRGQPTVNVLGGAA
jgi:site-specific recombinase XerD